MAGVEGGALGDIRESTALTGVTALEGLLSGDKVLLAFVFRFGAGDPRPRRAGDPRPPKAGDPRPPSAGEPRPPHGGDFGGTSGGMSSSSRGFGVVFTFRIGFAIAPGLRIGDSFLPPIKEGANSGLDISTTAALANTPGDGST